MLAAVTLTQTPTMQLWATVYAVVNTVRDTSSLSWGTLNDFVPVRGGKV